jgi:hypothetical protein
VKFPGIKKEAGAISSRFTNFVKPFLNSNTASLAAHRNIRPHPVAIFLSSYKRRQERLRLAFGFYITRADEQ